jgi:hypothetical protein
MRVVERGNSGGLVEALAEGNGPVQPRIARLGDFAHAARAYRREDLVRAESRSVR